VTILQAVPLGAADSDTRTISRPTPILASRTRLASETHMMPPRRERQHTEGVKGPAESIVAQP
jgi:hypothetical protein